MIEWTTILIAIIGSVSVGEIINLFTARETKKGMQLDNKEKEDNRWEKITNELQEQNALLNERLDKKDELLQEKDDIISDLRTKLDNVRTQCSVATLLRCNKISCVDRIPPISEAVTGDISKQLTDYVEKM